MTLNTIQGYSMTIKDYIGFPNKPLPVENPNEVLMTYITGLQDI
eukprot:SAG31_NODE_19242_length_608_cov_1.255403_1_plen_44_part_00